MDKAYGMYEVGGTYFCDYWHEYHALGLDNSLLWASYGSGGNLQQVQFSIILNQDFWYPGFEVISLDLQKERKPASISGASYW